LTDAVKEKGICSDIEIAASQDSETNNISNAGRIYCDEDNMKFGILTN